MPQDFDYQGFDIAIDPTTNAAIVTGQFSNVNTPTPGRFGDRTLQAVGIDAFVMRVGASGTMEWIVQVGGSDTDIIKGARRSGEGLASTDIGTQ